MLARGLRTWQRRASSFQVPEKSFSELFEASPLAKLDKRIYGRQVQGVITSNEPDRVVVDIGLKFPGVLTRSSLKSIRQAIY